MTSFGHSVEPLITVNKFKNHRNLQCNILTALLQSSNIICCFQGAGMAQTVHVPLCPTPGRSPRKPPSPWSASCWQPEWVRSEWLDLSYPNRRNYNEVPGWAGEFSLDCQVSTITSNFTVQLTRAVRPLPASTSLDGNSTSCGEETSLSWHTSWPMPGPKHGVLTVSCQILNTIPQHPKLRVTTVNHTFRGSPINLRKP